MRIVIQRSRTPIFCCSTRWLAVVRGACNVSTHDPDYPSRPRLAEGGHLGRKQAPGDNVASRRPYETVLPLCGRVHLDPVVDYGVGDEKDLVKAVTGQTGTVLIAWEHKNIIAGISPCAR